MGIISIIVSKYKLPAQIAAGAIAILLVSWVAGQCTTYSKPKPTKTTIDAGIPIAGPSSQAPTVPTDVTIARPDLTLDELKAEAKKYGMVLSDTASEKYAGRRSSQQGQQSGEVSSAKDTPIADEKTTTVWPMFLGAESFKHAPSGADVDVSAWLPGLGQRVDLRASWRSWVPPAAAPAQKQVVCQSGGFFENEAKWYGGIGAGVVANSKGAGLGPTADLGYFGPRTGKVTWGAGSHAAFSQQSGFQGDASFRMSW